MQIDFLLVGQGLAGSLLAWELLQHNCRVLIVDNGDENASQIAAGLINPVTGMRLVKSSDVDILLPYAQQFYTQLEQFFGKQFYVKQPILRVLSSAQEVEYCRKRFLDPTYHAYLEKLYPACDFGTTVATTHGLLQQRQTGYVLTRILLQNLQEYFIAAGCYRKESFNYQEIKFTPRLQWREYILKNIVFCEGYQGVKNPWFGYLPFQPVKGEILTLQLEAAHELKQILNFGHWIIPLNTQQIRVGATFEHENLDTKSTPKAQEILLHAIAKIAPKYGLGKVIAQHANVRPTTIDKQPFLGKHPQFSNLSIFNGFGAKGSLQIPWYSQQFVRHLLRAEPITQAADIARFATK